MTKIKYQLGDQVTLNKINYGQNLVNTFGVGTIILAKHPSYIVNFPTYLGIGTNMTLSNEYLDLVEVKEPKFIKDQKYSGLFE